MLASNLVEEVRHLLDEGRLSQRKIALQVGISRNTVGAIAQGKRPEHAPVGEYEDLPRPVGPPRRCPTCGGLVFTPCLLCHIRAIRRQGK